MFNGLPAVFDDKVQNTELYVQKRIYQGLKFLTLYQLNKTKLVYSAITLMVV